MPVDHGHPVDLSRQCEAQTQQGRQCRNHALVGKPCCALHGGEAAAHQSRRFKSLLEFEKQRFAKSISESEKKLADLRVYLQRHLEKSLRRPPTDEETSLVLRLAGVTSPVSLWTVLPNKKDLRQAAADYASALRSVIERGS